MDLPFWGTFHPQFISDENNLQVQEGCTILGDADPYGLPSLANRAERGLSLVECPLKQLK